MFLATRRQGGWLAAAASVLLAGSFLFFSAGGGEPIHAVEVKQGPLLSGLTTNGKLEPSEAQELHASGPGLVRRLLIKEGDQVRAGQLLAEMGQGQAASEVARARAELEAAQAEAEMTARGGSSAELLETERKLREARAAREEAARTLASNERLLARNAIPRYEVAQSREHLQQAEREVAYLEKRGPNSYSDADRSRVQARVNSARAALAYAGQQLGSTHVTAPTAGTVYSLPIRQGNFVNTGDLLARIGQLQRLRVVVFVDEPELGRVAPAQKVRVTWSALPGQEWSGTVERVPVEVSTLGTRSVGQVVCTLDNADRKLLANINVDVEIILQRRASVLTLPKESVVHAAGPSEHPTENHYVYVVENNTLRRQLVKLGASSATRFEIAAGLQAGQLVALPGERPLEDKMKVKVLP